MSAAAGERVVSVCHVVTEGPSEGGGRLRDGRRAVYESLPDRNGAVTTECMPRVYSTFARYRKTVHTVTAAREYMAMDKASDRCQMPKCDAEAIYVRHNVGTSQAWKLCAEHTQRFDEIVNAAARIPAR